MVTLEQIFSELLELKKSISINTKEVLSMDEAVFYTGLSKDYLYHLVSGRRIPFYKSEGGGRTYFRRSELDNWLLAARYETIAETEAKIK